MNVLLIKRMIVLIVMGSTSIYPAYHAMLQKGMSQIGARAATIGAIGYACGAYEGYRIGKKASTDKKQQAVWVMRSGRNTGCLWYTGARCTGWAASSPTAAKIGCMLHRSLRTFLQGCGAYQCILA